MALTKEQTNQMLETWPGLFKACENTLVFLQGVLDGDFDNLESVRLWAKWTIKHYQTVIATAKGNPQPDDDLMGGKAFEKVIS